MEGEKVLLGFVETSMENHRICKEFLQRLIDRGLRTDNEILFVIDGANVPDVLEFQIAGVGVIVVDVSATVGIAIPGEATLMSNASVAPATRILKNDLRVSRTQSLSQACIGRTGNLADMLWQNDIAINVVAGKAKILTVVGLIFVTRIVPRTRPAR